MSDEPKDQQKKIIIDEDWKTQVEAERDSPPQQQQTSEESAQPAAGPMPPPTLTVLASSLYLQGMVTLGLLPNPMTDKPEVQLDQARHAIDTLQMLQEKTAGNRTPEESKELEQILYELRMAYLAMEQKGTSEESSVKD